MRKFGIGMVAGSVVGGLFALWWWAIAGIPKNVGLATGLTVFLAVCLGGFLWAEGS